LENQDVSDMIFRRISPPPTLFSHQKSPLCSEQNPPFHDLQGEPGVGFHGHHDGQVAANVDHFTWKCWGFTTGNAGISWDFMDAVSWENQVIWTDDEF
jgi:hypothetical protein